MSRNRIWVNFSKEYTEEYFNAVKEENFSNLVCKLLRDYYKDNGTTDDYLYNKLDKIYEMLENLTVDRIELKNTEEEREDFEIW